MTTEHKGCAPELPALDIDDPEYDRIADEIRKQKPTRVELQRGLYAAAGSLRIRERQLLEALAQLQTANEQLERAEAQLRHRREVIRQWQKFHGKVAELVGGVTEDETLALLKARLAAVPAGQPEPLLVEEELERLSRECKFKFAYGDYRQGFNDGVDRLLSRLREVQSLEEKKGGKKMGMIEYAVAKDTWLTGDYRVEAIDAQRDGEVYLAIFTGPDAEARAREYANWKNSSGGER